MALKQGLSGETQPNGPIHTLGKGASNLAKMERMSSDYNVLFILSYNVCVFILRWHVLELGPLSRCELRTAYCGLAYYQLTYCRHLA